jgi:hypothetical protein
VAVAAAVVAVVAVAVTAMAAAAETAAAAAAIPELHPWHKHTQAIVHKTTPPTTTTPVPTPKLSKTIQDSHTSSLSLHTHSNFRFACKAIALLSLHRLWPPAQVLLDFGGLLLKE